MRSTVRPMRCFLLILGILALLMTSDKAPAQVGSFSAFLGEEESELLVDYAAFNSDAPGKVRLEIYYQIYNRAFSFERADNVFEAAYDLRIDVDGKQRDSLEQSKTIRVADTVVSMHNYRTNQANFDLVPGKYEVKVTLKDLTTRRVIKRDFKVKLKEHKGRLPQMSHIEMVEAVLQPDTLRRVPESFRKADLILIPSVARVFGGDGEVPLRYYLEIYRSSDSTEEVLISSLLRNEAGRMVYRDSLRVELSKPMTRQLQEITVTEYPPGEYSLEVSLLGRRFKELDDDEKDFRLIWTQEALLAEDYDVIVGQIAIIATPEDLEPLRRAGGLAERKEAFDEFWRSMDPTPGTAENEVKRSFYYRVRVANEAFTYMARKGWKTDRGRIYIRYGEPDQVDDHPFVANASPYQEWHYYRFGRYRRFTFVDRSDDGDYRLLHPYPDAGDRPEF